MTDTSDTTTETDTTPQTTETTEEVKPGDDGRFDAAYVESLRSEAADRRTAAKAAEDAAEALRGRLLASEVKATTATILVDPGDLLLHTNPADLLDDDGEPDPAKIKTAAEALVTERPHLGAKRVTGDVGQGARGGTTPPVVSFGELLQGAARGQ
jgi:hypothetical protein